MYSASFDIHSGADEDASFLYNLWLSESQQPDDRMPQLLSIAFNQGTLYVGSKETSLQNNDKFTETAA